MFEKLDADVLHEISSIDRVKNQTSDEPYPTEILGCLKAATRECRTSPESTSLSEIEIQQIERGLLAAQRIATKVFKKYEL